MQLKITLEGDKKVSTLIGSHLIMTDQPTKFGGGDSSPAPFDLLVASIGTCAGFYVQSYCQNKGIDASGIELTLDATRDAKAKTINGFVTTIHIPPDLPEKLHSALKRAVEQCAVTKLILGQPEFTVNTVVREP